MFGKRLQFFPYGVLHLSGQDRLTILRTPHDMVLQRIHIPSTICQIVITLNIHNFLISYMNHVYKFHAA